MTILEILEAHTVKRPWSEASRMRCKCGEVVIAETEGQLYALHRAHVAEVLDKHMQEREAQAWDRGHARALAGIIPTGNEPEPRNPYRKEPRNGR